MQVDRINLYPKKLQKSQFDGQTILVLSWVACAAVLALCIGFNIWQDATRDAKLAELTETENALSAKMASYQKKADWVDLQNERLTQTNDFLAKKVTWTGALQELSLLIPKTVWLSNFTMRNPKKGAPYLEIVGSATSQRKIASFLESLEMSYYFHSVNLKKSEKVADMAPDLYRFELDVQLPMLVARGSNEQAK